MQSNEKDFNYYYRHDLLKLLNAFNQINSFRFTDFIEFWNEMKFYQIFALPRFFPFEYRTFMKDILKITAEYFYDNGLDLEVRTAALYTLYALYFHQMNRPRMKIAVTPDQWISILQFIDLINQAEHIDVEYCFRYLLYSDAFEFCSIYETQHVVNLKGNLNLKNPKTAPQESKESETLNMTEFAESIINDTLTEDMGTIHEAYLQIKEELIKSNTISSKLTYINPDFKQLIGANFLNEDDSDNEELLNNKNIGLKNQKTTSSEPSTSKSMKKKKTGSKLNIYTNESESDN